MNAPDPISANPSDFQKNLVAVLGEEQAAALVVMQPTCELRYVERWMMGNANTSVCLKVLQQRWRAELTGLSEWRDVPTVREGEQ